MPLSAFGRPAFTTLAALLLVCAPGAGHAQTLSSTPVFAQFPLPVGPKPTYPAGGGPEAVAFLKGRVLIGANVRHALTPDGDLGSHWSVSPVIRNTPRRPGWGPSFGLSGYKGDIVAPVNGQKTRIGEIRIRPIMGGVSYSIGDGPLRTSFSVVGGYAFTSARVTTTLPSGIGASIDISDAWVIRPNVGLAYALTRRLAIIGSVGYVYTNPTITISVNQPDQAPRRSSGTFRSDYVSITVGTAVSIF